MFALRGRTCLCLSALAVAAIAAPAGAQPTGTSLHDPSRMLESNGKVFVYITEGQGGDFVSSDGLAWQRLAAPAFNPNLLSGNQGVWAPDGIFLNGQYYLYYAMWSSSKQSALALITSPSLDPTASNYKWTDRGIVVHSPASPTYSMIDPCPVLDAQGNLWVSWGGGYPFNSANNSIWVTRLDNTTGLPLASDPVNATADPGHPIATGHREGSYVYYHAGYYYLFWQTGGGFNPGTSYQINMSRATAITGPYTGDQIFYSKNPGPGIFGPGHMGIYTCGADERFTYHYYSDNTNSGSSLGENTLTWASDGWPRPGPISTTPLKLPCSQTAMPGGGGGDAGLTPTDASDSTNTSTEASASDTSDSATPPNTSSGGGSSGTGPTQSDLEASVGSGGSSGGTPASSGGGSPIGNGGDAGSVGSGVSNAGGSSGTGCSAVGGSTSGGGALAPVGLVGLLFAMKRRRAIRGSRAA